MATVVKHGKAFEVTGLREAVRDLERLGVDVQDLRAAFSRIAGRVVTDARQRAPKRTERLANSVRASKSKNKAVVRAGYAKRAPHAGPINYGWPARGIRPTFFLTDAANANQADHVKAIEADLAALARKFNR